MMMNLFSIFDPSTSLSLSLNWLSMWIFLLILLSIFLILPISYHLFLKKKNLFINFMFNEFKILISYSFSNIIIFLSLILFIFFNNFLGLFPYIFTASSHVSFCFSLSFSFWVSLILFSFINYSNNLLAHLTPLGTPFMLMPFMVIIESISLINRPFTLTIHLMANMITLTTYTPRLPSNQYSQSSYLSNSHFNPNFTLYPWNRRIFNSSLRILNFMYFM